MGTRSSRPRGAGLLLAGLVLAAVPAGASARPKTSDSVVKATALATRPDAEGKQTVTVMLEVERPWHLYANPVGNKDMEDNQTEVTVGLPRGKPEKVSFEYPPGKLVKDSLVGDYRVYEDRVVIKAHLQRARGDTSPLEVSVKVQACSSKECLLPSTIKLPAP